MHGRVKVRSTEEEKARKEKERQAKLKVFKEIMMNIYSKRNSGELDQELLELINRLLTSNPDIYTLWNLRREVLINLDKKFEDDVEMKKIYDEELYLTEICLKINPKSYGAWHHREWVLMTRPDPDWKKELTLCNKYLSLDERNFHTWDYRRFIVSQCNPCLKAEFDFTTEKIHENFSNYSAWHYRSKMLIELYPDLEGGRRIEDSHHKHELKLVLDAAFTDPDDTSAWFYQRWLLGAVKETTQIVVSAVSPETTTVAFNKNVSNSLVTNNVQLLINNSVLDGQWTSCSRNLYDTVWIYKHKRIAGDLDVKITYDKQIIECKRVVGSELYVGKAEIKFQRQYSNPVIEELKKQLISCRQLLDFEPNNKWTLLTTAVFLHCIDSDLYHKESTDNLVVLKEIDKLRAGYYEDLATKWHVEHFISTNYNKRNLDFKLPAGIQITSLPHLQYFSYCENVDLGNQKLTSRVLPSLAKLCHCKVLNLENNCISTLKSFPKIKLQQLNLKGNKDIPPEALRDFKIKCDYDILY